jgi:hypothetical protein
VKQLALTNLLSLSLSLSDSLNSLSYSLIKLQQSAEAVFDFKKQSQRFLFFWLHLYDKE